MTDYAEERASELEVLESIFPDELTVESSDKLSIKVQPEVPDDRDPYVLHLHITYTPTYPDELPEISLQVEEGNLDESEVERLVNGLKAQAEDSLGMAMVYTLAGYLQESLAELVRERKERIAKAEAEAYRLAEEAEAKKHEGEKVTPESYAKWRAAFDAEMAAKAKKEEEDRLKALPPREREEAKRWAAKPTGRELFAANASLAASDAALGEGEVSVDASQYERVEVESDDEEDTPGIARLHLSDDEN